MELQYLYCGRSTWISTTRMEKGEVFICSLQASSAVNNEEICQQFFLAASKMSGSVERYHVQGV